VDAIFGNGQISQTRHLNLDSHVGKMWFQESKQKPQWK